MFYDIKSFDGAVLFGKNIICFMADILHYINTRGSAMELCDETRQNKMLTLPILQWIERVRQ